MRKRIKKALDSFFEKCNKEIGPDVVANKADKIDFDLLEVLEKIYASPIQDNSSFAYTQSHLLKNSAKEELRLQRYDAIMITLINSDYHSIMAVRANLKSNTSGTLIGNSITVFSISISIMIADVSVLFSISKQPQEIMQAANVFLFIHVIVALLLSAMFIESIVHNFDLKKQKFILQVIEDLLETRNIKR